MHGPMQKRLPRVQYGAIGQPLDIAGVLVSVRASAFHAENTRSLKQWLGTSPKLGFSLSSGVPQQPVGVSWDHVSEVYTINLDSPTGYRKGISYEYCTCGTCG